MAVILNGLEFLLSDFLNLSQPSRPCMALLCTFLGLHFHFLTFHNTFPPFVIENTEITKLR